jgi:integrase
MLEVESVVEPVSEFATLVEAILARGELAALRWEDVDLATVLIQVSRAWDEHHRAFTAPKTRAGTRRVPTPAVLRDLLDEHKLASGRVGGSSSALGRSDRSWRLHSAGER